MVDYGNAPKDRWVCPNDRQLALRAKLKTGWSVKTQSLQQYGSQNASLDEAEQEVILQVIKRAEMLEVTEQERVGRLVERLDNMKRHALGNGSNQCVLCGDTFGLLGAQSLLCHDCNKAVCHKCGIVTGAASGADKGAETRAMALCKICSETREMWKKSGAWFFKGLPKYVLPEKKSPQKGGGAGRYLGPRRVQRLGIATDKGSSWANAGQPASSGGGSSSSVCSSSFASVASATPPPSSSRGADNLDNNKHDDDDDDSSSEGEAAGAAAARRGLRRSRHLASANATAPAPPSSSLSSLSSSTGLNQAATNGRLQLLSASTSRLVTHQPSVTSWDAAMGMTSPGSGHRASSPAPLSSQRSETSEGEEASAPQQLSGNHHHNHHHNHHQPPPPPTTEQQQASSAAFAGIYPYSRSQSVWSWQEEQQGAASCMKGSKDSKDLPGTTGTNSLASRERGVGVGGGIAAEKKEEEENEAEISTAAETTATTLLQNAQLGTIELSLLYDPVANALHCSLHRAKGLKPMDINGLSDPFCRLNILPTGGKSNRLRTKTVHKTRNPEFNETLTFYGVTENDMSIKVMHILVLDDDKYGHDFIGEARIPLIKVQPQQVRHLIIPLEKHFLVEQEDDEVWMGNDAWTRGQILLTLCYSTRRRALVVGIVRCANLIPMDNNGFSDPFVKLRLKPDSSHKKYKTSTKWKNLNPVFNEEFIFDTKMTELPKQFLEITVWDKDYGKSNDYLGGLELGFHSKGERLKHWVDMIKFPDHKHEGWHNLGEEILGD